MAKVVRNGDPVRDCIAEIQYLHKFMSIAKISGLIDEPTSTVHRWTMGPVRPAKRKEQGFKSPFKKTAERVLAAIDEIEWDDSE